MVNDKTKPVCKKKNNPYEGPNENDSKNNYYDYDNKKYKKYNSQNNGNMIWKRDQIKNGLVCILKKWDVKFYLLQYDILNCFFEFDNNTFHNKKAVDDNNVVVHNGITDYIKKNIIQNIPIIIWQIK